MSALVKMGSSLPERTIELERPEMDVVFGHQLHKLPKA
jgi:hypothetical protein